MEAATGVLLHIPSRRTPDLTSVVASFASMLRSCSPASPPLPVLLLTHPSIASTLAHPLSQLLTGQADLLSAIPPASADGSLDGPHAWDLVPGKAVRLAAVPLEEARAGREGLIQSLNWLAATSCPPPPLQARTSPPTALIRVLVVKYRAMPFLFPHPLRLPFHSVYVLVQTCTRTFVCGGFVGQKCCGCACNGSGPGALRWVSEHAGAGLSASVWTACSVSGYPEMLGSSRLLA